jgi:uncharacterized membrane protein
MCFRITGLVALTSYLLLLMLIFGWILWFLPPLHWPRPLLLIIGVLPLAIPLRGVLHGRPHSYFTAIFISLLYFLHGTGELWAGADQPLLTSSEALLALVFFISATLHLRLQEST